MGKQGIFFLNRLHCERSIITLVLLRKFHFARIICHFFLSFKVIKYVPIVLSFEWDDTFVLRNSGLSDRGY